MNANEIKRKHVEQTRILKRFIRQVKQKKFVYSGRDQRARLRAKVNFLQHLKWQLEQAFDFNDFQAEFVVNEAVSKVLLPSNEDLLVYYDTKKAEKLTKASFVLGHHYFRFIETML